MTSDEKRQALDSPLPARKEGLWTRPEGNETVVYDTDQGLLHRLNPSALAIWELCDGTTTLAEVIEAVVTLTGNGHSQVEEQVRETIDQLAAAGLLED